jgi:hypothetical protein
MCYTYQIGGFCQSNKTTNNCPSDHPFVCYDGLCVKTLSDCADTLCVNPTPYRCVDGSCVDDLIKCAPKHECPLSYPIYCPDGLCASSIEDCMKSCTDGLYHCQNGSCVDDFTKCNIPPSEIQINCVTYTQSSTGTLMPIYNINTKIGSAYVSPYTVVESNNKYNMPPITICPVDENIIKSYTAVTDFIVSPIIQISSDPTNQEPLNSKMNIKLKIFQNIKPSDYCLAIINKLTGSLDCVDQAVLSADADGIYLSGNTNSIKPNNIFMFISKSSAGTHCGGTTPILCSDGSCKAYIQQCVPSPKPSDATVNIVHCLLYLFMMV